MCVCVCLVYVCVCDAYVCRVQSAPTPSQRIFLQISFRFCFSCFSIGGAFWLILNKNNKSSNAAVINMLAKGPHLVAEMRKTKRRQRQRKENTF